MSDQKITDETLNELLRLEKAATPGPSRPARNGPRSC